MIKDNGNANKAGKSAKECAFIAVFVATVIAAQLALSSIPGVEVVTVLFVAYAFAVGCNRSMLSATIFSFLRQIIFGFYPTVLVLYLVYFNLLTLTFGCLGKKIKNEKKYLILIVLITCVGTATFTLLDNVITPLWYGYGAKATRAYFIASLSFMIPQIVCTAVSVTVLFLPLLRVFSTIYKPVKFKSGKN